LPKNRQIPAIEPMRNEISFTFFKRNGAVSAEKNAINWIGKLKVAPYVIFHALSSMLSAALKKCGDVTAADDALDFLVGGSLLLAEALLACNGAVCLREWLLLSRSSQSHW
jgi:hypothetical protein